MFLYLEKDLEKFIDNHIDSFIKWDLIAFFHSQPQKIKTAKKISEEIGRKPEEVEKALKDLVKSEIVKKIISKKSEQYKYAPSPPQEILVNKFISSLESREKRLLILTKILQKETKF